MYYGAEHVARALSAVDRAAFLSLPDVQPDPERLAKVSCLESFTPAQESEYDRYLSLDHPVDHALQLDALRPWLKPGACVLDCGSGSGYLSAVFALLVASDPAQPGSVVALERQMSFHDASNQILYKTISEICQTDKSLDGKSILEGIMVLPVDGTSQNYFPKAPYDAIRVGFSLPSIESDRSSNLLAQLKRGGRMIAHVQGDDCLTIVDKDAKSGSLSVSKAAVASKFPPALFKPKVASSIGDEGAVTAQKQRRDELFAKLQAWRQDFSSKHGRAPTRVDMIGDPEAKHLFVEFSKVNTLDE